MDLTTFAVYSRWHVDEILHEAGGDLAGNVFYTVAPKSLPDFLVQIAYALQPIPAKVGARLPRADRVCAAANSQGQLAHQRGPPQYHCVDDMCTGMMFYWNDVVRR